MNLKPRLQAIASLVPANTTIADIGTDHGYLPIFLVKSGKVNKALACDYNEGPLLSASKSISKEQLEEKIETRLGSGLSVVHPQEVDMAIFAGMGGSLMIQLLEDSPEVVATLKGLILQPQEAIPKLRQYLIASGFQISRELLVVEDERLYTIILAVPSTQKVGQLTEIEALVGPCLLRERPPLFSRLLTELIAKNRRIIKQMSYSEKATQSAQYRKLSETISILEDLK